MGEAERRGDQCRALFAALIGGRPDEIALVPSASVGVGLIAASLPRGTRVVVPDDEFTSVLYPLLVAQERHQVRVNRVPYAHLAAAIDSYTDVVAFSATRSQDGLSAPLAEVVEAAKRHHAQLVVDATHAIPFLPIAPWIADIDYLVCHGYKHLLCPRGAGFLHVREDHWQDVAPWLANWWASDPAAPSTYGGSLGDLAPNARRFDVSLPWQAWCGAEPSLRLLVEWQQQGVLEEVNVLARRLALGLGLPEPSASIVSFKVADAEAAESALSTLGIRCAARGGNIRLSPHVYNTHEEIDRAIAALRTIA